MYGGENVLLVGLSRIKQEHRQHLRDVRVVAVLTRVANVKISSVEGTNVQSSARRHDNTVQSPACVTPISGPRAHTHAHGQQRKRGRQAAGEGHI